VAGGGGAASEGAQRASAAASLVARAREAVTARRWMEALDLGSQALVADPSLDDAAAVVGIARHRLGGLSPGDAQLRQLTVVAVDMCASTAIAAGIGPERYRELMMDLYDVCVEAVGRYDGRVVKYSGDGVLAQFGHPITHEDDGRRATLCALAILDSVERRGARWEQRYGTRAMVRIGLDTGIVAVGPVDASPWSIDEIAGDPPNIASRVQATADPMSVWVTEATRRLIVGWFGTEPIGLVDLRNYPRQVLLHRVLQATDAENRLEASTRPRPLMVDRVVELELLRGAWNHVNDTGERRVVGLTGPAGIGKSRLAEHMIAVAVACGATPVTLACSPLHRASPLRPVVRALRRQFRITAEGEASDAEVLVAVHRQLEQLPGCRLPAEEVAPILASLLGGPTVVDVEPDVLRRRGFDALTDLFEGLAARGPVVLHVDDMHAADPSTAELLLQLLARPSTAALLVILAGRTLPDSAACDAVVELTGLGADDATALARSVAPDLDDGTIGRIVERCDGLPFYVEELAHSAVETHAEVRSGVIELSAFVAARLDELGAPLRRLAGQIAIAGSEIDVATLARLSDQSTERLGVQIAELTARGVLRRTRNGRRDVVTFRHDVLREVAYQTLLVARRGEQHLKLARILAEQVPRTARPDDLARQYTLGGDHAGALASWLEAGRAATATGARHEAIELFTNALRAIEQLPAAASLTGAELEAQLNLGTALSTIHGYTSPQARAAFERARELADALDDNTAIFPALWGIWSYWFVLGEHDTALALGERCVAIAEQETADERFRWTAAGIVGYELLYLGDFAGARDKLELAARHVGSEPVADFPNDPLVVSHAALSVALWFLGEYQRSASVAEAAAERASGMDPGNRRTALNRAWVYCMLAWRAELAGDPATAIEFSDRAVVISTEHGYSTWLAAATLHRSIAQCTLGQTDEGLPTLAAVVGAWQSAGRDADGHQRHPVLMTPYFAGRLAQVRHAVGDLAGAGTIVAAQLEATAANGEHFWDGPLRALRRTLDNTKDPV
jgi:class 3 adenylate cyclase/tetratricopeptide (TPR) repeat protein